MAASKKKYFRDDFEKKFGITYLEHNVIRDERLKKWDVYKDKEYTINPGLNDRLEERYGALIKEAYCAPMSIQLVNRQVGYGAYAESPIKKGQMVCEYVGVIEPEIYGEDNLYLWDYPTVLHELTPAGRKKKIAFCINAEKKGNVARFINHSLRKYQNVGIEIIPYRNEWHVVYIAQKDIAKGEQLLTYYGMQYWRDRNIVPFVIEPGQ